MNEKKPHIVGITSLLVILVVVVSAIQYEYRKRSGISSTASAAQISSTSSGNQKTTQATADNTPVFTLSSHDGRLISFALVDDGWLVTVKPQPEGTETQELEVKGLGSERFLLFHFQAPC